MAQKFLSVRKSDYERCRTKTSHAPWIKLHRELLGDREFIKLTPSTRFLYISLLMLCTENENRVYNDRTWIAQRLYIPCTEVDLTPLYRGGFLETSNLRRLLSEERRGEERIGDRESADAPPAKVVSISRASGFPEGFQFNERADAMAKGYGLNVHKEFAAFRDHHVAKGSVFKDWDAAFRTWLRNAVKFAAKVAR